MAEDIKKRKLVISKILDGTEAFNGIMFGSFNGYQNSFLLIDVVCLCLLF